MPFGMTGRYRRATLMAVLLVASESGRPPDDCPLARSLASAGDRVTVDHDTPDIAATLLIDSASSVSEEAVDLLLGVFETQPEFDAVYGDAEIAGRVHRRPAWSPLRLFSNPADLDHLAVRGRHARGGALADRIRLLDAAGRDPLRVGHLPAVIASSRHAPTLDADADAILGAAAAERGLTLGPHRRDRRAVTPGPMAPVSIVIPTAATPDEDGRPLVLQAIEACLAAGADDLEVLLVVGDECRTDPLSLSNDPRVRVVRRPPGDWSFSVAANLGILEATHPVVVLLNDDVEMIDSQWLGRLLAHLADPTVGAVGALLLYPDRTCQHVGMIVDDAYPLHPFVGRTVAELESLDADLAHDCIAVTAACLAARRADLLEVGGLSEDLPFGFNDVDLCYKLLRSGRRIVVEPSARLVHHESASREPVTRAWEWDRFIGRWGEVEDPWYHPGHHRPDDPTDRRRNADHLDPAAPHQASKARPATIRSRVHHARLRPPGGDDPTN